MAMKFIGDFAETLNANLSGSRWKKSTAVKKTPPATTTNTIKVFTSTPNKLFSLRYLDKSAATKIKTNELLNAVFHPNNSSL